MSALPSFETVFLRDFTTSYVSEISITADAEQDLLSLHRIGHFVGLPDVLSVLRDGNVTCVEKEDADGSYWEADGENYFGQTMRVKMQVWCDQYRIRITGVELTGDGNE